MTTDNLTEKFKKRNRVPEVLKSELEQLIKLAGYEKDKDSDLQSFANIGGGAAEGISNTKINWVLKESLLPREDFLYALATISAALKDPKHYENLGIDNPKKHELERYLSLCDYGIVPGSIFPASDKYRNYSTIESPKYLSSIPNIFWDLDISFTEIIKLFSGDNRPNQQIIDLSSSLNITFGMYNYLEDKQLGQITTVCSDADPDIFRFKLENNDQQRSFRSIEAIRTKNNARILIVLLNGNWIELTNAKTEIGDLEWQDLSVDNFFSFKGVEAIDSFFWEISDFFSETEDFLSMEKLASLLDANPIYKKVHQQLTLVNKNH